MNQFVDITLVNRYSDLKEVVPPEASEFLLTQDQTVIPAIAKNADLVKAIEAGIRHLTTHHRLILGDSRFMEDIEDESVHLVVTSPPYWTLKEYPNRPGQLGLVEDYETFLDELDKVWQHVYRVLVPAGALSSSSVMSVYRGGNSVGTSSSRSMPAFRNTVERSALTI